VTYVPGHPPAVLRGIVTGISGYAEYATTPVVRREAPTGGCTLILAWGGPLSVDGLGGPSVEGAFLAGLAAAAGTTSFTGHQAGVQVDLTPLGAACLLGRGGAEVAHVVTGLDLLDLPDLAVLPERLAGARTWDARFALVAATLTGLLARSAFRPDPEVAHAWRRLAAARGRVPVGELAAETGWSRRHLLGRFHRQVGLPPTVAGRVLRFRHAANLLVPGSGPDRLPSDVRIADVAATCGYSDHSHLVREFRELAGCTPGDYLRAWFPDVQDPASSGS
jgi:AraC-like DNA-binding protein